MYNSLSKENDKEECKEVQSQEEITKNERELQENIRNILKTENNSGTKTLLLDDQIENVEVVTVDSGKIVHIPLIEEDTLLTTNLDNEEKTNQELLHLEEHAEMVTTDQEVGQVTNESDEKAIFSDKLFDESNDKAFAQPVEEGKHVIDEATNTFVVDNQISTIMENSKAEANKTNNFIGLEFQCNDTVQDMDNSCAERAENLNKICEKTDTKMTDSDITKVKDEEMNVVEERDGCELAKPSEQSEPLVEHAKPFEKFHYIVDDDHIIGAAMSLVDNVAQNAVDIVAMTVKEQEKSPNTLSNEDINHTYQDTEVDKELVDIKLQNVEAIDIEEEGQNQVNTR